MPRAVSYDPQYTPRNYQRITVTPLAGALGAEVAGVDVARLDDETFAEIHRAFLDHLLLLFRDQALSIDELKGFAGRFGRLKPFPYARGMDGHPEVLEVRSEPMDSYNFGGGWHSDASFMGEPVTVTAIYARTVPTPGSDTLFANMYLAYDTLSDGLKRLIDGLEAIHTAGTFYAPNSAQAQDFVAGHKGTSSILSETANEESVQPVAPAHPETGRKVIYVNEAYTVRFKDMTEAESRPLLETLWRHLSSPDFTCRIRWQPNALAIWDNRCTQHYALNDYAGQRRLMYRATACGAPFAPAPGLAGGRQ